MVKCAAFTQLTMADDEIGELVVLSAVYTSESTDCVGGHGIKSVRPKRGIGTSTMNGLIHTLRVVDVFVSLLYNDGG
jgi:hypothetical protein